MALDDRDYMRERHRRTFEHMTEGGERPFASQPGDSPPLLLKVLAWVCIAFIAYEAWSLWEARQAVRHIDGSPAQATMLEDPARDTPALPAGLPPLPDAAAGR